jgi:hypothetical protein
MRQVEDSIAARLEHLDLVVESLDTTAVVPLEKALGDLILPSG